MTQVKNNSQCELKKHLKELSDKEQVYTIALFDILGFLDLVKENKTAVILDLYQNFVDLIKNKNIQQRERLV